MMATTKVTAKPDYVPTADDLNDAILAVLNENESPIQPSPGEVQSVLQEQNPTWKLPERRVAKFLKKQKKVKKSSQNKTPQGAADDEASMNSSTSRTKQLLHSTGAAIKSTKKSVRHIFSHSHKENESSSGSSKKSFSFRRKKKHDGNETTPPAIESVVESAPSPPLEKKLGLLPELNADGPEEAPVEPVSIASPEEKIDQPEEVVTEEETVDEEKVKTEVSDRDAVPYEDDNTGKVEKSDICSGCVIL